MRRYQYLYCIENCTKLHLRIIFMKHPLNCWIVLERVLTYDKLMCNTDRKSEPTMKMMLDSAIQILKLNHIWLMLRDRLKHFTHKPTWLSNLRLSSSDLVNHVHIPITGDSNKNMRGICPLCASIKRIYKGKTLFQCRICKVPVCTRIHVNKNYHLNDPMHGKTYLEVWYTVKILSGVKNCDPNKINSDSIPIVRTTTDKVGASIDKIVP